MVPEEIRILVVDDHPVVRHGLVGLLRNAPDFAVVGEAENGEEALFLCQKLRPDIALMDVRMQGMGGIAATEAIRRFHTNVRVIGLSSFADEQMARTLIARGAHGVLSKAIDGVTLIDAIRRIHGGETLIWLDSETAAAAPASAQPLPEHALAAQQRRVLALLTQGCTNNEIAQHLGISMPTARYHVSAILLKLGVANRVEAAAMAVRDGLVPNPET